MFLIAPMEYNDVDNNSHEWIGDFLENTFHDVHVARLNFQLFSQYLYFHKTCTLSSDIQVTNQLSLFGLSLIP
jgi:hypothetical protein